MTAATSAGEEGLRAIADGKGVKEIGLTVGRGDGRFGTGCARMVSCCCQTVPAPIAPTNRMRVSLRKNRRR